MATAQAIQPLQQAAGRESKGEHIVTIPCSQLSGKQLDISRRALADCPYLEVR